MNTEDDEQIRELLNGMPEQLQVFKKGITPQTQQAYLEYSANVDIEAYASQDTATKGKKLFNSDATIEDKKKCLILLAHEGTADACLIIRKFLEVSEDEVLKEWGAIALEEGWLLVESDLFEKPTGMVLTGLGGEEDHLRYFFAVGVKDKGIDSPEPSNIEQRISLVCGEYASVLEELQIFDTYMAVQILVPMDVAVGEVIDQIIIESNREAEWLERKYFVTNSEIPSAEQILRYLEQVGK
jgi:hypothetical protein